MGDLWVVFVRNIEWIPEKSYVGGLECLESLHQIN